MQWIIRPQDLLVLAFDLVNLQVQPGAGEQAAATVKAGAGQAFLVVWFPPQSIAEEVYFTTVPNYDVARPPRAPGVSGGDDPDKDTGKEPPVPAPIPAVIAGWSRLVFEVPDGTPIEWTLEGVLRAMRDLPLSVPANALPPKKPKFMVSPLVRNSLDKAGMLEPEKVAQVNLPAEASLAIFHRAGTGTTEEKVVQATDASPILAVARGMRKVRSLGNVLGLTTASGSDTIGLARAYLDEWIGKGISEIMLRPEPSPPKATETSLELPYQVILSPNRYGAWFHAERPMTSIATGHTELWHTRLGVRRPDGTLVDGYDPLRKIRAVWTTAWPPPKTPEGDDPVDIPNPVEFPWRRTLNGMDKHNVVHLSSNFRLNDGNNPAKYYEPNPLDVDLLTLSSLGGWLDSRGVWDFPQPRGLSVEEWRHRMTLGRDHYVRVVYSGFLFPFGHRASLVKISERQFHPDMPGNPAYLRQRMFLIVREPLKTYRSTGLVYDGKEAARKGERYDLMMPFEAVRILTKVSPLLDRPEDSEIASLGMNGFWPFVGGRPFQFHLKATDTDVNEVDLAMPLIFVGKQETDKKYGDSKIPTAVRDDYGTRTWPGGADLLATVPLTGQKVAFAGSAKPGDTTSSSKSITFGSEVPAEKLYEQLGWQKVRFFPVVRRAQINVPALQRIARTTTPASVVYDHDFLVQDFHGGQVFLAAEPGVGKLGVKFSGQSDRSGGLVAPDLELSGLSRITGPVSGDLKTAGTGTFDPKKWFGPVLDAKLFGVFRLGDVLESVGFDELDKLPQFIGQELNQVEQMISGLERLHALIKANPLPEAVPVDQLITQLLDPATGSISGILKGGDVGPVAGQLASLKVELGKVAAALPASGIKSGPKAVVTQLISGLGPTIDAVSGAGLLANFAKGDLLPQTLNARFEWCPVVKGFEGFSPYGMNGRNLVLSVEAAEAQSGGDEVFTITCALNKFDLSLEVLVLHFERVQIQAVAGKKMDVDVNFTGFEFIGPLAFVETLRQVIPFDGFSDPPSVEVSPAGIKAGFTMALPNLSVGVFSLENLSLGAGFNVPFVGPPMSTWFQFCTRENPSRLTVSLFGGGFFLGVTVDANGPQILEGAIEFGAACSLDFGVASGSVSVMAGLYFKIEGSDFTLAGYFRVRGDVEALGIVTVSIELYLEMRYESKSGKCVGTATLSIEVDVSLFSVTVEITCTKKFAGSGADPTLAELMDVRPDATSEYWNEYCAAFA